MPPSMPRPAASGGAPADGAPRRDRPGHAIGRYRLAGLIAAAIASGLPMVAHATALTPLCDAGEAVAFACRMARSGKTVSVCERPGHLVYRFGVPGRIELALPEPGSPEVPHLLLEDGGSHTLRGVVFTRGSHAYAVTHFVGGRPPTEELAVSVQRDGSPVALLKCAQTPRPLGDLPGLLERRRAEGARLERR
jgi:hypothetical protein